MKFALIIIFITFSLIGFSQKTDSNKVVGLVGLDFKIGGTPPFKAPHAAVIEGRIGTIGQFQDERLRLDIGNSFALNEWKIKGNPIRFGGDFMTYTRLRSEGKFKFPVETTDYYFGINGTYHFYMMKNYTVLRARLAHISSHIIDGFADKDGQLEVLPFTYSREFLDLLLISSLYQDFNHELRVYFGSNFIFSKIPRSGNWYEPQIGFDYERNLTSWLEFRAGYDFRMLGQNDIYQGANAAQFGLLFRRNYSDKGIYVGYYFYEGYSMHGMFIGEQDSYSGIGFQIYY